MKSTIDMGKNKTGIGMAPKQAADMADAAARAPSPPGDDGAAAQMRADYITRSGVVGTVPPPATMKGALKSAGKMITGMKPTLLIDLLGERLAFERTGARLYEAAMTKISALGYGEGAVDPGMLQQIHREEMEHAALLAEALEKIGADPTAETPCADIAGVQSIGLLQVINDPRTTISQTLNALLTAELVDNASWELLIDVAQEFKMSDMADEFRRALEEENRHLATVRGWLTEAARREAHGEEATA